MDNPLPSIDLKTLLEFAMRNGWAALGIGIVIGLYLLGRDDDDNGDSADTNRPAVRDVMNALPTFATPDDEIAFHEKRLAYLKQMKQHPPHTDHLLDELIDLASSWQDKLRESGKEHHD